MNSLSLLIYIVGVAEKIEQNIGGLGFFSFMFAAVSIIGYVASVIVGSGTSKLYEDERATANNVKPFFKKALRYSTALAIVVALINLAFPTKQTMILIAASEVTETVITSPAAQKALSEVGSVGSEAAGLLKSYIAKEQAKIAKELAELAKKEITN